MIDVTNEQQQLLLMRGVIASLPKDKQDEVMTLVDELRKVISEYQTKPELKMIAYALLGAEMSLAAI